MQEIFKKIIERLEGRRGIAARDKYESKSSDDRSYYQGADYGYYKAIKIVNQVADIYGGEELHDRNKIYDYIKTQINPYGKPFQGSVKEFGYKVMDYIDGLIDVEYSNSEIPNMSEEFCEWRLCDEDANVYDTTCRNPHILLDGNPIDNNYSFCPHCGKKIKVVE